MHFAVQCQLHGAKLRKLATDRSLSLNASDVSEAELKPGDTIQAGKTAFVVAFDGQTALQAPATTVSAAVVGGELAAATQRCRGKAPGAYRRRNRRAFANGC